MPLRLSFGVEFEFAFVVNQELIKDPSHWLHVRKNDLRRPNDSTDHEPFSMQGFEQLARILQRAGIRNQVLPSPKVAEQDFHSWGITSDVSVEPDSAVMLQAAAEDPEYFGGRVTEDNVHDFEVWGMEVVSRILPWEPLPNGTIADVHGGPYSEVRECLNAIRGAADDPFLSFANFKSTGLHVHIGLPPVTAVQSGGRKRQKDQDQIAADPPRKRSKLGAVDDSGDATMAAVPPEPPAAPASAGSPPDDDLVDVDAASGLRRFGLPILQQLACLLFEFEGVINLLHPESRRGLTGSSVWAKSNRFGLQGSMHVCDRMPTRLSRRLARRIFAPDMTVELLVKLMSDGGNPLMRERKKFVNWTNLIQKDPEDEHIRPKTTLEFRQHAGTLSVEDTCQWVHLVGSLVRAAERRALANWSPQNIETTAEVERAYNMSKTGIWKYSQLQWRYWDHQRDFERFCTALALPPASRQYWEARYQRLNPHDFADLARAMDKNKPETQQQYWQTVRQRRQAGTLQARRPNHQRCFRCQKDRETDHATALLRRWRLMGMRSGRLMGMRSRRLPAEDYGEHRLRRQKRRSAARRAAGRDPKPRRNLKVSQEVHDRENRKRLQRLEDRENADFVRIQDPDEEDEDDLEPLSDMDLQVLQELREARAELARFNSTFEAYDAGQAAAWRDIHQSYPKAMGPYHHEVLEEGLRRRTELNSYEARLFRRQQRLRRSIEVDREALAEVDNELARMEERTEAGLDILWEDTSGDDQEEAEEHTEEEEEEAGEDVDEEDAD